MSSIPPGRAALSGEWVSKSSYYYTECSADSFYIHFVSFTRSTLYVVGVIVLILARHCVDFILPQINQWVE